VEFCGSEDGVGEERSDQARFGRDVKKSLANPTDKSPTASRLFIKKLLPVEYKK
tara:strand:- start:41 stop:202 length:162 start_codon:yes stop_codon:yes gene_type:complete